MSRNGYTAQFDMSLQSSMLCMKNPDWILPPPRPCGVIVANYRAPFGTLESVAASHERLQASAQESSGLLFWLQHSLPRLASITGLPLLQMSIQAF